MEMREKLVSLSHHSRFRCRQCGECCHRRRVPLTACDIERLQESKDPSEFILIYGDTRFVMEKREWDDGCVFLDDGKCTVHAKKPLICRLFPVAMSHSPLGGRGVPMTLADGSTVYLYVDVSCPGVGEGEEIDVSPLLELCLAIRNEMLVTDLAEVLKVIR